MSDLITKADLARELGVSRARVTQLCELGLPVRPDGKLNRTEAMRWAKANIDPALGGWWGDVRPKQTGRRRASMTAGSIEDSNEVEDLSMFANLAELADRLLDGLPDIQIPDWEGEIREQGIIDFINGLRQTKHIANFARMALLFGCTMQQVYAVAQWFDRFMASYCISKNPQRVQTYQEPDWSRMATEAGTTADVVAWREWMNRILEEEGSSWRFRNSGGRQDFMR